MYYAATLEPHTDGSGVYDVSFADVPGCVSQGKNLDDALSMAAEALRLHIGHMIADGDKLPKPSTPEQAKEKSLQFAKEEGFEFAEGTLWQYIYFEPDKSAKKEPPVRLNISLKPSVIELIDYVAEEMGLTRSGVIAVATRDYAMRIRANK